MRAILEHIEQITPTIKTFWLRPERPVRYTAGQFTELYLPHEPADERGVRRWFTLSSSPTEELLGITTRFESDRGSSFKQQLAALQPGTQLHLADPMGDFVLPKDPTIPLVFVAAGLGITPVRSMITWLHDTKEQRTVHLFYKVSRPEELAFAPLFKDYQMALTPIITELGDGLTSGRVLQILGDAPLIYISGPEDLVETLYKELRTKGVDSDRLVGDYFPGYKH